MDSFVSLQNSNCMGRHSLVDDGLGFLHIGTVSPSLLIKCNCIGDTYANIALVSRDGLGGRGPGRGAPLRGARLFSWLPVSRRGSRDVFGGDGTFRQRASMVAYIQGFGNSILCNL